MTMLVWLYPPVWRRLVSRLPMLGTALMLSPSLKTMMLQELKGWSVLRIFSKKATSGSKIDFRRAQKFVKWRHCLFEIEKKSLWLRAQSCNPRNLHWFTQNRTIWVKIILLYQNNSLDRGSVLVAKKGASCLSHTHQSTSVFFCDILHEYHSSNNKNWSSQTFFYQIRHYFENHPKLQVSPLNFDLISPFVPCLLDPTTKGLNFYNFFNQLKQVLQVLIVCLLFCFCQ